MFELKFAICTEQQESACLHTAGDVNLKGREKGLGNNHAQKCLAGMPQFLNSANFLLQIFNRRLVKYHSNFQNFCSTVYSLPIISLT